MVTEVPIGTTPQVRHVRRHNHFIAGLSLGVVGPHFRSGSLITTPIAQETGRELSARPGSPLDPRSRGGNDLVRQRGHRTETARDAEPTG